MKTKVTVQQTNIKYVNNNDVVSTVKVVGALNITECKNHLKEQEYGVFISKEVIKETFEVNTIQLLQLKEV